MHGALWAIIFILWLQQKIIDLSDILRDFKKFTSKQIIAAIISNQHESRKDWMLKIFREEGAKNSRNKNYQFWRQDNQPQELYSPVFIFQKINYTHNNRLKKVSLKDQNIICTAALKIILKQKNVDC